MGGSPVGTDAVPSDRCPRCGGAFHCGANDTSPCPCTTVQLDQATLDALQSGYCGCLCMTCLKALAAGTASTI
jgi:hypothetical protein